MEVNAQFQVDLLIARVRKDSVAPHVKLLPAHQIRVSTTEPVI